MLLTRMLQILSDRKLWMMLVLSTVANAWAQLPMFRSLNATDGLSDNQVLQMLQLEDGRMAIATAGNVNIYDGNRFSYIHRKDIYYFPLSDYDGYYHLYLDRCQRLWVKDHKKLLCMNLRTERYVSNIEDVFRRMGVKERICDFFIDADKNIWRPWQESGDASGRVGASIQCQGTAFAGFGNRRESSLSLLW